MSLLAKPCPRCKGRGKIPNLLLPGKHICRRCEGAGEVPTFAGRIAARLIPHPPEEEW